MTPFLAFTKPNLARIQVSKFAYPNTHPDYVHTNEIADLKWSPDGKYIALSNKIDLNAPSNDRAFRIVVIDPYQKSEKVKPIFSDGIKGWSAEVSWSSDGKLILVEVNNSHINYVYEFKTGKCIKIYNWGGNGRSVWSPVKNLILRISSLHDERQSNDYNLTIFDPTKIANDAIIYKMQVPVLYKYPHHQGDELGASWSPDGKKIAIYHNDGVSPKFFVIDPFSNETSSIIFEYFAGSFSQSYSTEGDLNWSPNSKFLHVYYRSNIPHSQSLSLILDITKQEDDSIVYDLTKPYTKFERWLSDSDFLDYHYGKLNKVNLHSGNITLIDTKHFHVESISPNGRYLVGNYHYYSTPKKDTRVGDVIYDIQKKELIYLADYDDISCEYNENKNNYWASDSKKFIRCTNILELLER
jgi:hypothetical protein